MNNNLPVSKETPYRDEKILPSYSITPLYRINNTVRCFCMHFNAGR